MNEERLLTHLHGHLGWLAAAALLHPAIALARNERRRMGGSVLASTLLVSAAVALGFVVYTPYRATVRRALFADAPAFGWLFERKEHLAFGALAMAWAGAIAYFSGRRAPEPVAAALRRTAVRAFVTAAAFAVFSAVSGTLVTAVRGQ